MTNLYSLEKNENLLNEKDWIYTEGEKHLPIEEIKITDFSSNDKTDTNELTMGSLYKKYNIEHISLWKFINDNKSETFDKYPLEWTGNCIHCGRPYNNEKTGEKKVPIFPPHEYNEKNKCWILEIIPQCLITCSKGRIIESSSNLKDKKLGLLSRFIREFFDPNLITINYIPLASVKELNPIGGIYTWEEYDKKSIKFNGMIKYPPFRFVNTSIELIDLKTKEQERKKEFTNIIKSTPEEQENYFNNIQRVVEQRKEKKIEIKNSNIGKQLGFNKN